MKFLLDINCFFVYSFTGGQKIIFAVVTVSVLNPEFGFFPFVAGFHSGKPVIGLMHSLKCCLVPDLGVGAAPERF